MTESRSNSMPILLLWAWALLVHQGFGELTTLKPFSTFLKHAHLIMDPVELGIIGESTKEDNMFSPRGEKEEELRGALPAPRYKNVSSAKTLPLELYKGTDDNDAYFITLHEFCDDRALEGGRSVFEDHKSSKTISHDGHARRFSERSVDPHEDDGMSNDQLNVRETDANGQYIVPDNINQHQSSFTIDDSKPRSEIKRSDLPIDTELDRAGLELDGDYSDNSSFVVRAVNNNQALPVHDGILGLDGDSKRVASSIDREYDDFKTLFHSSARSNDKLVRERTSDADEYDQDDAGDISVSHPKESTSNPSNAKDYITNEITRLIEKKEDELMSRLETRPAAQRIPEYGNSSTSFERRSRSMDPIDHTISFTDHERTMMQEMEMTYKKAQDIADAVLRSSEAVANKLELCKRPVSPNFIRDEPLTETENVIDQIVSQLKESLEENMGRRTCVKPHKDLILFLRWLVFDDVSVKLCPTRPKGSDLKKNYLLFSQQPYSPDSPRPNQSPSTKSQMKGSKPQKKKYRFNPNTKHTKFNKSSEFVNKTIKNGPKKTHKARNESF